MPVVERHDPEKQIVLIARLNGIVTVPVPTRLLRDPTSLAFLTLNGLPGSTFTALVDSNVRSGTNLSPSKIKKAQAKAVICLKRSQAPNPNPNPVQHVGYAIYGKPNAATLTAFRENATQRLLDKLPDRATQFGEIIEVVTNFNFQRQKLAKTACAFALVDLLVRKSGSGPSIHAVTWVTSQQANGTPVAAAKAFALSIGFKQLGSTNYFILLPPDHDTILQRTEWIKNTLLLTLIPEFKLSSRGPDALVRSFCPLSIGSGRPICKLSDVAQGFGPGVAP
jgi:hypothetical protein